VPIHMYAESSQMTAHYCETGEVALHPFFSISAEKRRCSGGSSTGAC